MSAMNKEGVDALLRLALTKGTESSRHLIVQVCRSQLRNEKVMMPPRQLRFVDIQSAARTSSITFSPKHLFSR